MAVTTSNNATIRGVSYTSGQSFKCYYSAKGATDSEGAPSTAKALTKGSTYYFLKKASGNAVTHSYLVGSTSSASSAIGWYKEEVFPYATYAVKYNANGGSGAPSQQTKTYGTNLTLSSVKPTRTGYEFLGWGTSETDTSVDYAPGATYSTNAAITLYAIWKIMGLTHIYTTSGWKQAIPYIYTTSGWKQVIPYVYTASGWKQCA